MLFSDDVLFVHVPKTGGMSITKYLINNLPGPLTLAIPSTEPKRVRKNSARFNDAYDRLSVVGGQRHETLQAAAEMLAKQDRSLDDFRLILAVIRNPYDLEVSHFEYLQKVEHARLRRDEERAAGNEASPVVNEAVRLALAGDFRAFVQDAPFYGVKPPRIERFYTLDGHMPPALRLIRFERMAEDLAEAVKGIGLNRFELPHLNPTKARSHWRDYLKPEIEAAIYEKYRFLFEFYPRCEFDLAAQS